MIIWLASYPKSGNTLLRSILSTYFYSQDGVLQFENLNKISQFPQTHHFLPLGIDVGNEKEVFKNFINAQNLINEEKGKLKFFKTHSSLCKIHDCNFTDLKNTLGAIYIVRDPRNVVTSFAICASDEVVPSEYSTKPSDNTFGILIFWPGIYLL